MNLLKISTVIFLIFASSALAETSGTTGTGSLATPVDSANPKLVKHTNHHGSKSRKNKKPVSTPSDSDAIQK